MLSKHFYFNSTNIVFEILFSEPSQILIQI